MGPTPLCPGERRSDEGSDLRDEPRLSFFPSRNEGLGPGGPKGSGKAKNALPLVGSADQAERKGAEHFPDRGDRKASPGGTKMKISEKRLAKKDLCGFNGHGGAGVQIQPCPAPRQIFIIGLGSHHGGVVPA